jgi:hypothetical protein
VEHGLFSQRKRTTKTQDELILIEKNLVKIQGGKCADEPDDTMEKL